MTRTTLSFLTLALLFFAGCRSRSDDWIPADTGAMASVSAFRAPGLNAVHRVAVLPAWGGERVRESERETVTVAVLQALQRANLFEVVTVSAEDLRRRYGTTGFSASAALPPDLFTRVREDTAADAILFVEVTTLSSYPPLALGLKARLESLDGAGTLWAFDHFFNANDPSVALAAKRHNTPGDPSRGSIQLSPSLFAHFVTTVMTRTFSESEKP